MTTPETGTPAADPTATNPLAQDPTATPAGAPAAAPAATEPAGDQPSLLASAQATPPAAAGSDPAAGAQPAGDGKQDDKGASQPPAGAPEEYKPFKLPEGLAIKPEVMQEVAAEFKRLNLTQEAGQSLIDLNMRFAQSLHDEQMAAFEAQKKAWRDESVKTFGANLERTRSLAAKARDAFASQELIQLLEMTGLGENVHVINYFAKIGEQISEDRLIPGKQAVDLSKLTPEERIAARYREEEASKGAAKG